ncbi:MAG: DUF952 domain-containing protein [Salaquimonas sp.]|nr:DUF952 domain-containing protein [Salaquimonas sp.]
MNRFIYKIATRDEWQAAEQAGRFDGAPVDLKDGFIHFSTAGQVRETAARHFGGQGDLVLVEIEAQALGEALKYEASRGGALFPHLYARLDLTAVTRSWPLPLGEDGHHVFPPEIGA